MPDSSLLLAESLWDAHFRDPAAAFGQAEALLAQCPPVDEQSRPWLDLTIGFHHLLVTAAPVAAQPPLIRALEGFRATRNRRGEILARTGLARLLILEQAPVPAREQLLALYPEAMEHLPPGDRFWVLNALGATYFFSERIDEAIRYLYEALETLRSLQLSPQLPTVMSNLAAALITVADYAPARELAQDALGLLPHYNNPQLLLFARSNLAEALLGSGDRAGALAIVDAMMFETERHPPTQPQNHYCAIAAEVYALHGRIEQAAACAAMAVAIHTHHPGGFNAVHARWAEAAVADARDDDAVALAAMEHALVAARRLNHLPTLCKAGERAAMRSARLERFADAFRYQQALTHAQTQRLTSRAGIKYYLLKVEHDLQHARADRDRAERERQESEAINRQLERLNAELVQRMREIEELQARLSAEAVHDPLTQLFNRRYLDMVMPGLVAAAGRRDSPLAVALVDLDHFKHVNDHHGHPIGDLVLTRIGHLFGKSLRPSDVSCRYGGEEFCILLPDTDAPGAKRALDVLATDLRSLVVECGEEQLTGFTFSAGIAVFPTHGRSLGDLIASADRALYAAKNSGRNRVLIASGAQRRAS